MLLYIKRIVKVSKHFFHFHKNNDNFFSNFWKISSKFLLYNFDVSVSCGTVYNSDFTVFINVANLAIWMREWGKKYSHVTYIYTEVGPTISIVK